MRIILNLILILIFLFLVIYGGSQGISCANEQLYDTGIFGVMLASTIDERILGNDPVKDYNTENQFKVDILHYDISLEIHFDNKSITGETILTGLITDRSIEFIDLNFYDNMKINLLLLNDTVTEFIHRNNKIRITKTSSINDTFKLKIHYEGRPKSRGFGSFTFGKFDGKDLVYTLNEPVFASTWFPCNDIPSDKALLDFRITADSFKTSVSNGKLVSINTFENNKTYHWRTVYPIATYLISFYTAEFEKFKDYHFSSITSDTLDLHYYVFPDRLDLARIDFAEHSRYLDFFEKTFGEYPFINEKYGIAEFIWKFGAMEHQTITGIGYNFVTGNQLHSDLLIHELAHHWWGNAVTLASWKDIWLNEGFATYSEALYDENSYGKEALKSSMRNKFDKNFTGKLYNPGRLFSNTIYNKGAWVLHMLRFEVGDSSFFSILNEYYCTYKYKSVSTEEFVILCNKVSGKDLSGFFQQWVFEGEGIIELEYEYTIEKIDSLYEIKIGLNQVQTGFDEYYFNLEMKLLYENEEYLIENVYVDKRENEYLIYTEKEPQNIIFDPYERLLARFSNKIRNE